MAARTSGGIFPSEPSAARLRGLRLSSAGRHLIGRAQPIESELPSDRNTLVSIAVPEIELCEKRFSQPVVARRLESPSFQSSDTNVLYTCRRP